METYVTLFARRRWLVAAFALAMTALAIFGVSRIRFDDVPRRIFENDDADYAELLRIYEEFGSDDGDVLLVLEADDWFREETSAFARELVERCREVDGVEEVVWFGDVIGFEGIVPRPILPEGDANLERARERARAHPLVGGRLVSDDDAVALVVARLHEDRVAIGTIEPAVDALRDIARELPRPAGVEVGVTGVPPIRVDIYNIIRSEQTFFFVLGGVLCSLLALFLFRSIGAVICTTVPPLVGALWAYGVIGLAGQSLDILSGILSVLVIVIALTDSIHLMIDVRLSRAKGASAREAALDAIRHLGTPCALTSLTTAVGFGSLALAGVPTIRRFGLLAACSVVMAFLAVITVMPLLVSLIESVGADRDARSSGAWSRRALPVVRFVMRRPRFVSIAGVALTVALLLASSRLVPENRLTEALPHEEAYDALMRCEEAFGGVLPSYVLIEWDEDSSFGDADVSGEDGVIAEVSRFLATEEVLAPPLSILDLCAVLPNGRARPEAALAIVPDEIERRLLRNDLRRTLVLAQVPDEGSDVMLPLIDELRAGLSSIEERFDGVRIELTGTDVVARSSVNRMIEDLARSLGFAALVIFGVIALEFRSLRLGLISLLPNLFPLALVGGALYVTGRPLQMAGAVLFTVLLGLAVDDTIHFLSRYRRERRARPDAPLEDVLESAFLAVGRAILITTLVLGLGFLTVAMSTVPTNRSFALLSVLGLAGAFIGDLLLLPALLRMFPRSSSPK